MQPYRASRVILGIVQVIGWVVAAVGVLGGIAAVSQKDGSGVGMMIIAVFAGAFNHAVMAIGLAIFDLVAVQRDQLVESHEIKQSMREILTRRRGQSRAPNEDAPTLPTTARPGVQVIPEPVIESQPLTVGGDVPRSRTLNESDLARLEAEQRKRERRT